MRRWDTLKLRLYRILITIYLNSHNPLIFQLYSTRRCKNFKYPRLPPHKDSDIKKKLCNNFQFLIFNFLISMLLVLLSLKLKFLNKPSVVWLCDETWLKLSILVNLLKNIIFCVKIFVLRKLRKKMRKNLRHYERVNLFYLFPFVAVLKLCIITV